MAPVDLVDLVCLLILGVVVFCTILGSKNGTISSANVPSSSREAFFTAAIIGVISVDNALMNLRRTSSSPTPTLLAIDISLCRHVEGLPVICVLAINF